MLAVECARAQAGLSLVELMVAMTLGVALSFAAVTFFLQGKLAHVRDLQTARVQENGRYAQRYLARELAMAGFYAGALSRGGLSDGISASTDPCYRWLLTGRDALQHFDNIDPASLAAGHSPLPAACLSAGDTLVEGTDLLVVRRVKDRARYSMASDGRASGELPESGSSYLQLAGDTGAARMALGNEIPSVEGPVQVWEYYPQILFIRSWSVSPGDDVPALCRKRLAVASVAMGNTDCLVEGVENMQFQFALDTESDQLPDRLAANLPAAGGLVVLGRIYLLLRSVNKLPGQGPQPVFRLGEENIAAARDGYYRRLFQTSSLLRNPQVQP